MSVTSKEHECLKLMAQGLKAKSIAETLKIKPTTVYRYVDIMKERFEVYSSGALVEIFRQNY